MLKPRASAKIPVCGQASLGYMNKMCSGQVHCLV